MSFLYKVKNIPNILNLNSKKENSFIYLSYSISLERFSKIIQGWNFWKWIYNI